MLLEPCARIPGYLAFCVYVCNGEHKENCNKGCVNPDHPWLITLHCHEHRYRARRHAEKYMTVILDGMDNSKTHLPRERRISKEHANVSKLRSHVVGAIVHSGLSSQGKEIFACLDLFEWPHDPNHTVNALICVLDKWNHLHSLAPVLYLQLDNYVTEKKKNIVICFLAFLVDCDIFEKST